jgi:hypothetical protein
VPVLKWSNSSSSKRTFSLTTSYPAVGNRSGFKGFRNRCLTAWNTESMITYQRESSTSDGKLALVIEIKISKGNGSVAVGTLCRSNAHD